MLAEKITGVLTNVFMGLILIGVCYPLLKGNIKRNTSLGFRYKTAYRSEEAWRAINRYGATWMIRWAVALIVVSLVVLILPINNDIVLLVLLYGPTILFVVIPAMQTYLYARNYKE